MEAILAVLGRLHPMVLHFPIGLVISLSAWDVVLRLRKDPAKGTAAHPPMALYAAAALTVFSAVGTGLLLSREGGYDPAALMRHRNVAVVALGLSAGVLGTVLAKKPQWTVALTHALSLAIVATGHFGANLTHGEGFVTAPLSSAAHAQSVAPLPGDFPPIEEAAVPRERVSFADDVLPVMQRLCIECHGTAKKKGGLALSDAASARRGGDGGPLVDPTKPHGGELGRRLRLPPDDDEHMPPRGKTQLSPAEKARLLRWIDEGGAF